MEKRPAETPGAPGFQDSPSNPGWYRKRIVIPPEAAGRPLEITLGTFASAYEVWCNGQRIGQTPADLPPPRPRTFAVPGGLMLPGRPAVIAIREPGSALSGPFPSRLAALPDTGPYVLAEASATPREAAPLALLLRERLAAAGFVTGVLRVFLALMLIIAWFTASQRRDLIALAALLGSDAATRLLESFLIALDLPVSSYRWTALLSFLSSSLLAWFALEVLGIHTRLIRLAIWLPPLWRLFMPYRLEGIWIQSWPKAALEIGLMTLSVTAAWKAFRSRGWRSGTGWMAVAIGLIAFLASQRIGALTFINVYWPIGGYLLHTYDVAVSLLAAGMTVYLLLALGADRREKERLASELEAARTVQQLLMTAPPVTATWETAAEYHPALQVGGDFYWTRVEEDGALTVAVGDVSGKGLRAAMLASMASGVLGHARGMEPSALLDLLNRQLAGRLGGGFVTCCCARFHPGGITIANAGHIAPYVDGRQVEVGGLPLGVIDGAGYTEVSISGERFVLVSDGVVEAANASGELFGFDRTNEISSQSAQTIAEAARAWGQNDDITVVTVKRRA